MSAEMKRILGTDEIDILIVGWPRIFFHIIRLA